MKPGDTEIFIPQNVVFYSNVGYDGVEPEAHLTDVETILRHWGVSQYIGRDRDTLLANSEGVKVARSCGFDGWVACGIPQYWSMCLQGRQMILRDNNSLVRGSVDLQSKQKPRLILRRLHEISAGYFGRDPFLRVTIALPSIPKVFEVKGASRDTFQDMSPEVHKWLDQQCPNWRDPVACWDEAF